MIVLRRTKETSATAHIYPSLNIFKIVSEEFYYSKVVDYFMALKHINPYDFGKPIRKPSLFAGRQSELDEIYYYLELASWRKVITDRKILSEILQ